jgi:hypothetical protein
MISLLENLTGSPALRFIQPKHQSRLGTALMWRTVVPAAPRLRGGVSTSTSDSNEWLSTLHGEPAIGRDHDACLELY